LPSNRTAYIITDNPNFWTESGNVNIIPAWQNEAFEQILTLASHYYTSPRRKQKNQILIMDEGTPEQLDAEVLDNLIWLYQYAHKHPFFGVLITNDFYDTISQRLK
jgi:hypothetical protein